MVKNRAIHGPLFSDAKSFVQGNTLREKIDYKVGCECLPGGIFKTSSSIELMIAGSLFIKKRGSITKV